jgi:hypothetical protein
MVTPDGHGTDGERPYSDEPKCRGNPGSVVI